MVSENHFSLEEITELLDSLEEKWEELESKSMGKQERLTEATKARGILNEMDDLELWCDQIENALVSKEYGDDLASVRFFRNKHQVCYHAITQFA